MTKKFKIEVIEDAKADLLDIYHYIAEHDSLAAADNVLDTLEALCQSLYQLASRGNHPPELSRIGITSFREVHATPYRVIYETINSTVYIHCVLDGRRDVESVLLRRLMV